MSQPTKGSIEAEIANAVVRFEREQQGRGPNEVRAYLLGDMVLVRCKGIFTATEAELAVSEEGRRLIKSARQELHIINHVEIEEIIGRITARAVMHAFYDVDVHAAEQVEVFVLDQDVEKSLLRRS